MRETLQETFYAVAKRRPGQRALGFYSPTGELLWLRYEELHARALRIAGWLRREGLRAGDACLLVLADTQLCAEILLAVLALGAIPLVVAPPGIQGGSRNQALLLRNVARLIQARLILTDDSPGAPEAPFDPRDGRVRQVEASLAERAVTAVEPVVPSRRAVAAYQLTSGTTGRPRVCVWRHRAVLAAVNGLRASIRLRADDQIVNWTPLYHDLGLVNNFFLCLSSGIPLVLLSPFDFVRSPALWFRALSDTRATQTWSPNFGFALAVERITDADLRDVRLDSVRAFWSGAERVHLETMLAFHERFRSIGVTLEALKTSLGCAENVGGATFSDPDASFVFEHVKASAFFERNVAERVRESTPHEDALSIVSVGRPSRGTRIAVLRRGKRVPDGHVGELALSTPSRMEGYLRDARATRRAVRGRYLMTGDLGYARGREIFWTGRLRERITIRGMKMDPSDFEPVLLALPGLRRGCFAVFGADDTRRGTQKIVVVAELRDNAGEPDAIESALRAGVLRQCGVALDDVVLVPRGSLTKTTSGKRRHRAYREQYADGALDALRLNRLG